MKIKNYLVTHLVSGEVTTHAGVSPHQLTNGQINAEAIASNHFIPPMEWTPNPLDYSVVEVGEK